MVRSWVESRRRGREDPLDNLTRPQPRAQLPALVPNVPASEPKKPTRTQALVATIRGIGAPLQSAVSEVASGLRERGQKISAAEEARSFAQLVQQVVSLARTTSATLEIGVNDIARWNGEPLRYAIMEAVSDIVGAHFRAAGLMQPSGMAGQIIAAVTQIAVDGARREDLMPGLGTATQARIGLDMLKAMPPAVHAVTRYTFGRNPLVLVTEVAWELQYKAVEITKQLTGKGTALDDWHAVYGATLHATGQIYAEAHFGEADRLSQLTQAERDQLLSQHGGEMPMTTVWDTFEAKSDLLSAFTRYLNLPAEPSAGSQTAASSAVTKSPF